VRRVSLGAWPIDSTLEQARDRANELTRAGRAGIDLLAQEENTRRQRDQRITVAALIDEYVKRRVRGRLRTAVEIESRLKRALAPVLDRHADDIQRRDIRVLLNAVADAGFTREAEQRRHTLSSMWKWAVSADIVGTNALEGLSNYDRGTPRERVLNAIEIGKLWQWLKEGNLPLAHADTLRVCLLLGARCGEIGGMQTEEVNETQRIWTLPALRSKNGQARVTPLVGIAWEIIERRLRSVAHGSLFPTDNGKPLTAAHVGHVLLCRNLPIDKFTTHDMRRTVASGLIDLGISMETTAAVLGHAAGGPKLATLRRHYIHTDRLEPKRLALEAWSKHVERLVAGVRATGNVVPLAEMRRDVQAGPEPRIANG